MSVDIQKIINRSSNPKLIEDAFEFAKEAYRGKNRISGENYIVHAERVALELCKMNLDPTTIAFGLLHDVLDDAPGFARKVEIKEIEKKLRSLKVEYDKKGFNLNRGIDSLWKLEM